jgi:hypothetical protein
VKIGKEKGQQIVNPCLKKRIKVAKIQNQIRFQTLMCKV